MCVFISSSVLVVMLVLNTKKLVHKFCPLDADSTGSVHGSECDTWHVVVAVHGADFKNRQACIHTVSVCLSRLFRDFTDFFFIFSRTSYNERNKIKIRFNSIQFKSSIFV